MTADANSHSGVSGGRGGTAQPGDKCMQDFLASSAIIDYDAPTITALSVELMSAGPVPEYPARCFCWVRDHITHSADGDSQVVTCAASEVLRSRVGLCYAKSHLLAAFLRSGSVPAGLSYQRLALDEQGKRLCLHGLVSVHVPEFGWYRIDPRGGRRGAQADYTPPVEKLVYTMRLPGEADIPGVFAEPLPAVVSALSRFASVGELLLNLPDVELSDPLLDPMPTVNMPRNGAR